jgi:hypothetical protein
VASHSENVRTLGEPDPGLQNSLPAAPVWFPGAIRRDGRLTKGPP